MTEVQIQTKDGTCRSFFFKPAGDGPWPAILVYMDGPGIRPAIKELAERLSGYGYAVLLPDLFYRAGPYDPVDPKVVFGNPQLREAHRERFMNPTTPERVMADTEAFLAFLANRPEVKKGPIGVTGYCMGGRMALIAAATFPDQIAAAASFHPGHLVTDQPSSPHLLVPKIKGKVYVAGAIEDASFTDDMKERLKKALAEAGVDHTVETYPAKHGWVLRDTLAYNPEEAEHHWRALVALMDGVLKR